MLFNSIQFLFFFPIVIGAYFLVKPRYRWLLLLLASYYFYMSWEPVYIVLILGSTFVDYFLSLKMGQTAVKKERLKYLLVSLFVNLGVLFTFKYFNFFNSSLQLLFQKGGVAYPVPNLNLFLPVGISFYTFQTLSYTIDVYNGKLKPEKHLGIFALYVAFFPQLVAGPIERSTHLLPQFHKQFDFDAERVSSGLRLIVWGLFKKMVISDRMAVGANMIFNQPEQYSGFMLLIGSYLFAWQIYCDFSGYSDIAIGVARVMGYDLMENFRSPYFSSSIGEFWQRWHISLSTWFRDYLYIPLGGNRVSIRRWVINILIVFVVSGLWHGANWTFVAWGTLHGFYLLGERLGGYLKDRFWPQMKLPNRFGWVSRIWTFHLVTIAWIFFRANSIREAGYIFSHLGVGWTGSGIRAQVAQLGLGVDQVQEIAIGLAAFMILLFVDGVQSRYRWGAILQQLPAVMRWAIYGLLVLVLLNWAATNQAQFIYFQF